MPQDHFGGLLPVGMGSLARIWLSPTCRTFPDIPHSRRDRTETISSALHPASFGAIGLAQ